MFIMYKRGTSSTYWETITDILREKKRSLPEECKEIRAKQLPGLKKELSRFDRKIEDEDARFDQNKTTLNGSRQSYINEINQLFDGRIDECHQKSEAAIQVYKSKREGLKLKVEYLEKMTTALDQDINTLPDHDILDMEKEMRDELEKALSYNADKCTYTSMFVPGQIDVQSLGKMIGEIHSLSMEEDHDINLLSEYICFVKPVSETNALVKGRKDIYAKIINIAGEELKTMKTSCSDLIISRSGEFALTSTANRTIFIQTEDEDTIRTIDTKPLKPSFVSKTENDDILVTMADDGDFFNLVPTSHRIVQRMTLTGKVLHTYEFKEDGKTRLFTFPFRAVENNNTDVCVINQLSGNTGELVVLHKNEGLKFTYRGDGLESETFCPVDVDCDSKCHILFTEKYSRAIHMLSAEGMHLCTPCQYDQLHPYVISIYGGNLWCGFYEGRLKVLKYKY